MDVYIEVVYIINLVIIMMAYEMMTIILNIELGYKKVCLYSIVTNVTFLVLYIDKMSYLLCVIWVVFFLFFFKKQIFLFYPTFIIIYFSLLYFIQSLQPNSYIYNGILITPMQYSSGITVLLGCFFLILQVLFIVYCKKKIRVTSYMYPICLQYQEHQITCTGFLDSGNEVYYLGYPITLLNKNMLSNYQVVDTIYVNSGTTCSIDIIKVDQMVVNNQKLKDIYMGVIENIEYDCLLNKQLMGGVL